MRVRSWYQRNFGWVPRPVRQVIVLVIGGTLLLLGLAGIVLPFLPGFIFIPLALAILAAEFAWAARWLVVLKRRAGDVQQRVRNGFAAGEAGPWPARWLVKGWYRVYGAWQWTRGCFARRRPHIPPRTPQGSSEPL